MAQKQLRRFPPEHHPFSLLTLIQSPPGLVRREEWGKGGQGSSEARENKKEEERAAGLMNKQQQQLVRREVEPSGLLLGDPQQQNSFSSRGADPTHCQTVAADLSLHSSSFPPPTTSASYPVTSASSFPPTTEPPPLFYPLLPARAPLTHNLVGYDFYQQGAAEFASESLPPPASQPFSDFQEYYDRFLFFFKRALYVTIISVNRFQWGPYVPGYLIPMMTPALHLLNDPLTLTTQ